MRPNLDEEGGDEKKRINFRQAIAKLGKFRKTYY